MQLLVSVRNAAEALAALSGGADIIDLKEPTAGPLGMVDLSHQQDIFAAVTNTNNVRCPPCSMALGEVADWATKNVAALPALRFAKLGLAGLRQVPEWPNQWTALRSQFDARAHQKIGWIAVSYVDDVAAQSPTPEQVVQQALQTGCCGVLFDTWDKSAGNLWSHLHRDELIRFVELAHAGGLLVAVAGRLQSADIPAAQQTGADIFAVRSAACRSGRRTNAVDVAHVMRLRERICSSLPACDSPAAT